MSHKLGHLSRIFAVEINKTRCYDIKRITRLAFVRRNCTIPYYKALYTRLCVRRLGCIRHYTRDYASGDLVAEIAACCLWHTSFWGYLPYQREESFRKITTDNLKLICTAKFYKNKFSEIIPSKREMMQIPSFRNEIRSDYEKKI